MLKVILSPEQKGMIADAVEKLFMFQGKKSDREEIALWANEICEWNYPLQAILTAIKGLNTADPRMFKLSVIKNACQDLIISENTSNSVESEGIYNSKKCKYCEDSGGVSMSGKIYKRMFACICNCDSARIFRDNKIQIWNGKRNQSYHGENYEFYLSDFYEKNYGRFPNEN